MSKNANEDFKKNLYENPFKKNKILEKDPSSGSVVQKLIIHHKKNLRKSMFFNSKEDFDKNFSQKEKSSNMVDRDINKDNKNNIITRNKELIFGNILMKKQDFPENYRSQNKKNDKENKDSSQNSIYIKIEDDSNEKNEINRKISNPFNINIKNSNENNIFNNPFKPNENPFKINDKDKINQSNPFINISKDNINSNLNKDTRINPFTKTESNTNNPFITSENIKLERNPFINNNGGNSNNPFHNSNGNQNNNPFLNNNANQNNNPFLNNNANQNNNPFLNNNANQNNNPFVTNDSKNIFTSNSDNIKKDSDIKEQSDDEEELKKLQEEVKIEKDENKLKNFKDVKYAKSDKFFETEIENLQLLECEQGKSKYISKGCGIFSYQEEKDEKGKKTGIFTLRDKATKNILLQGIVIDLTSVEKAKLKNGLEFILIKNILVKYSKYSTDKITEETKITFLRIRVKKEEIDNFYNKTNEFFNLIKK